MPLSYMVLKDFQKAVTPRIMFSSNPRLTISDAFTAITANLPDYSSVVFEPWGKGVTADVFPFCGPGPATSREGIEPTHLSYEFFPALGSVLIHRIKVQRNNTPAPHGVGSAMIASQLPLWKEMNVSAIAVKAHDMSAGFYSRLGFDCVDTLPEEPQADGAFLTLMRLDFSNPLQGERFQRAIIKAPPLTSFHLEL